VKDNLFSIDKLGQLMIDKIFFETNYPILFTCVNEKNDLFLCVCCQNNIDAQKWLITRTTAGIIVDMLEDKITLREAFLQYRDVQYVVIDDYSDITISNGDEEYWNDNSIYLPDKGEYIEAEDGEFYEEIRHYTLRNVLDTTSVADSNSTYLYYNVSQQHFEFIIDRCYKSIMPYHIMGFHHKFFKTPESIKIIVNQSIKLSYELEQNPKQENTNNSLDYNEDDMLAA